MPLRDVLVEHEREDWETRIDGRVTEEQVPVVDWNRHEEVQASEDGLDEGNDHATMDDELTERGGALVGEPAMPDDQPLDVAEFEDGEICGQRGLHTLLTDDT